VLKFRRAGLIAQLAGNPTFGGTTFFSFSSQDGTLAPLCLSYAFGVHDSLFLSSGPLRFFARYTVGLAPAWLSRDGLSRGPLKLRPRQPTKTWLPVAIARPGPWVLVLVKLGRKMGPGADLGMLGITEPVSNFAGDCPELRQGPARPLTVGQPWLLRGVSTG